MSEREPLIQEPSSDSVRQSEPVKAGRRISYFDNLRVLLTVLVIYHHATLSFDGIGGWYYYSEKCKGPNIPLILFVVLNQSFFMATFFVMSGHFSAVSMSKKSPWQFYKDRLMRLGIPMLAFTLFGTPLTALIGSEKFRQDPGNGLIHYWRNLRGVTGPVWYLAVLLCFDAIYAASRQFAGPPTPSFDDPDNLSPSPRQWSINRFRATVLVCLTIDIAASFFIRLWYPIGSIFAPLNLLAGYLPQYILAYVVGLHFTQLQTFFISLGHPWLKLFTAYALAVIALGMNTLLFGTETKLQSGGWNLPALFYAAWNEIFFYLLGTAWLSLYVYGDSGRPKSWEKAILDPKRLLPARYSYAAYLVHPIPVTAAQILLDQTSMSCVGKSFISGTLAVVGTWLLAWLIIMIPGVNRII